MRCNARIHDDDAPSNTAQLRQCTRRAVWFMVDRDDHGLCTQHKRPYDTRRIPEGTP